jgi:DNA-binding NarL/FixJ family response regulator
MPLNPHTLELLWRRLEDAKLQLDHCHNYIREIQRDRGAIPESDGKFAYRHALRTEAVALNRYLKALNDFKAALPLELGVEEIEGNADGNRQLTPREREVLTLIASGQSSKQISYQLGITFKTVNTHRYRLLRTLNARNTADLTRAALRLGLTQT